MLEFQRFLVGLKNNKSLEINKKSEKAPQLIRYLDLVGALCAIYYKITKASQDLYFQGMEVLHFEDYYPHYQFKDTERMGRIKEMKFTRDISVGIIA